MKIVIKKGRLIDPAQGVDATLDLMIENGKIAAIAENLDTAGAEVVDASGKLVTPMIIGLALIESLVIYALVIAFIILGKI